MKKKILAAFALSVLMLSGCANQTEPSSPAKSTEEVAKELIMSRRSIRNYKDSAISREVLDEILTCGVNAPNAMNRQMYEIRVLSPALIDSLSSAVIKDNPKMAERPGFKNIFVNAPCVICVAYDSSSSISQIDCGLLGENIMLAAWAKGIGSCCLGSSPRMIKDSPSAKPYLEKLGFSEGYEFIYCIALGYPNETPDAKPRKMDMIKFVE